MPDNDEVEAAEEVVAKKGYKRPSESITSLLSAVWLAVVAIFNIRRPEVIAAVGVVITSSGFLVSHVVDRSRS